MKYYKPNCSVPAAAVTYAGNLSSNQPILFTTQYGYFDSASEITDEKERIKYANRPLEWAISKVKVVVNRQSASTATCEITLIPSIPNIECDIPNLPDLSKIRGGNKPYLDSDDEIRVYAGYVSTPGTPITADMLDEHPVDLCPPVDNLNLNENNKECASYSGEIFKEDPTKPLCPIFWGFIDNINFIGTDKGGILNIQCRDRTRIFSDTRIIAVPALQGRVVNTQSGGTFSKKTYEGGLASGRREDILIQVAKAASGSLLQTLIDDNASADPKPCWKPIIGGSSLSEENLYSPPWIDKLRGTNITTTTTPTSTTTTEDTTSSSSSNSTSTSSPSSPNATSPSPPTEESTAPTVEGEETTTPPSSTSGSGQTTGQTTEETKEVIRLTPRELGVLTYTSYYYDASHLRKRNPIEDPALWIREAMFKKMLPYSEPRFHMWVQRPPIEKAYGASVFTVINKSPLQIISFLANQEERPTEFYSSHVNGDFVFAPSEADTSGFYDKKRFFRTYFFRTWPKEINKLPPAPNQMIRSMRVTSSSIGTFNRIVVIDSQNETSGGSFLESIRATVRTLPWGKDAEADNQFAKDNPEYPSGRAIYPPCKNQIIYDGTLGSYGNNDSNKAGGALITAISQARISAKESQGIELTLLGDPTIYPNEMIRVYNTVIHDYGCSTHPGTTAGVQELLEIQQEVEKLVTSEGEGTVNDLRKKGKEQESTNPEQFVAAKGATLNRDATPAIDDYVRKATQQGRVITDKTQNSMILPVYKVKTIEHTISTSGSNAGFTTKIEAITDY